MTGKSFKCRHLALFCASMLLLACGEGQERSGNDARRERPDASSAGDTPEDATTGEQDAQAPAADGGSVADGGNGPGSAHDAEPARDSDASRPSEADAAANGDAGLPPSITDLCAEPAGWKTQPAFGAAPSPPKQGSYVTLGFDLVAVQYARAIDRFVSLSANPPTLRIFDPRGTVERSVTLSKAPRALAIAPNAKRALVGDADSLTVVDLETGALRPLSFPTGVAKVFDAGGAYAYVTGSGRDPSGTNKALYNVELATGAITPDTSGIPSSVSDSAVIDVTHQRIYVQGPIQYARVDLDQGLAKLAITKQPEQFYGCGSLTITDDAAHIMDGCGSVFRLTDDADVMVYETSLPRINTVVAADHSQKLHQLAAVFNAVGISPIEPNPNLIRSQVYVFEDAYFDQVQVATLPDYEDAGQRAALWAQQLAYSADDQKLYVIAQTPGGSALGGRNVLVTLPSTFEPAAIGGSLDTEPYTLLHANILDAERSRTLDRIVYVSQDPDKLVVLDPNRRTLDELALPRRAADLTLDVEGRHAVVSFDGRLGYYELEPLRLVHMWPVPEPLDRIAIDHDGYVYDVVSSSHKVRIDITTGAVQSSNAYPLTSTGHYVASQHALLAPNADDIVRTEVQGGQLGTTTKPNADYDACWELWQGADTRLFGACGHVFSAESPMLYRGTLPGFETVTYGGVNRLESVDHSAASKLIAYVPSSPLSPSSELPSLAGAATSRNVSIVEDKYYGAHTRVRLPVFRSGDTLIPAYARYAFFSANGKRLDILAQSALAPNIEQDFGLISASLEQLVSCPQADPRPAVRGTTSENAALEPLEFDVVDAAYSEALDRIVVASSDPPKLRLLDPSSGAVTARVDLPLAPTRVVLAADQRLAVVGHAAWLSTVALEPPKVTSIIQTSASAFDIALHDGIAYVSPVRDQTTVLHVVDLASGAESLGVAARAARRQRISPDGLNLLSSYNLELHRMPLETARTPSMNYAGNDGGPVVAQNVGKTFWYSADRRKLFGSSGHVFDISSVQAATYPDIGALERAPAPNDLRGFAEHAASNRLAVIPVVSEGIELYDATTYAELAYYSMPRFATDSGMLESGVRFVFFTRDGKQLVVLVQALTNARDAISRYGLVRVPVAQ